MHADAVEHSDAFTLVAACDVDPARREQAPPAGSGALPTPTTATCWQKSRSTWSASEPYDNVVSGLPARSPPRNP